MKEKTIGKAIKEIRKKHHLTQQQFALKYHVSSQAVSKWENDLNLPDTTLLRQISKDFDLCLEDLFDGKVKEISSNKKKNKYVLAGILFLFLVFLLFFLFHFFEKPDFQFKMLSSECTNFRILGTIAYNKKKSAISISSIEYCGKEEKKLYRSIECTLYESSAELEHKIDSFYLEDEKGLTLENFLKEVTFSVNPYEKMCKEYKEDSLFLMIRATDLKKEDVFYKVPLRFLNCGI